MDTETLTAVSGIAESITSIGVLLLWVWAERRDNESLFKIIEQLTTLRLKQIEHEAENEKRVDDTDAWQSKNP
jgi:hypothetical protein